MISSNNPLQDIAFSLADITVLKANEVEGVVVLRVALSETQQGMHASLSGRKAVVLKWTRQTSMELAVHKLLSRRYGA